MNFDNLTDEQLATCVDEYVQRVVNWARSNGCDKEISVMISSFVYNQDSEYKVEHSLTIGSTYGGTCSKSTSNNAITAVKQIVPAMQAVEVDMPRTVRTMLAAPALEEEIDEDRPF